MGVSTSTVKNLKRLHSTSMPKIKRGPKKKLTDADKRFCVRAVTAGGMSTAVTVRNKLEEELGIAVHAQTVRNALKEAGLGSIEKLAKPMLSAKNIRARLAFAKAHRDWTVTDWQSVVWSDECKINRFQSDGRVWAWIRDTETLQPRHVKQTVKHGGGRIMVWGCFTHKGPGWIAKIDGNMNQDDYIYILQHQLMDTLNFYHLPLAKVIFQHDNDPKHTALRVRQHLENQPFQVLHWPAQSPDLNPIENLWAILKRRLNAFDTAPRGLQELWDRVQPVWNSIEPELCLKLVATMPQRMEAVIKARGRWIDF